MNGEGKLQKNKSIIQKSLLLDVCSLSCLQLTSEMFPLILVQGRKYSFREENRGGNSESCPDLFLVLFNHKPEKVRFLQEALCLISMEKQLIMTFIKN